MKQIIMIEQHNSHLNKFPKYFGVQVRREPTWVRNYEKLLNKIHYSKLESIEIFPVPVEIWHPGGGWAHVVKVSPIDPNSRVIDEDPPRKWWDYLGKILDRVHLDVFL